MEVPWLRTSASADGRPRLAERGPKQRKRESPQRVVTLSWGRGVLGNDNWKTRMKSARGKKMTLPKASQPHPPPLVENFIKESPWSGNSGIERTPFFLFSNTQLSVTHFNPQIACQAFGGDSNQSSGCQVCFINGIFGILKKLM